MKGTPDKMAVRSIGGVDHLLVGMVVVVVVVVVVAAVAVAAAALHLAEMAGGQVRLTAGMAGVMALVVGMGGTVALPLVEMTVVGEEGAHPREVPGMPQSLEGRTLQQGQIKPLLRQVHDEVLTVMMVHLDHVLNSSFATVDLMLSIHFHYNSGVLFSCLLQTSSHSLIPLTHIHHHHHYHHRHLVHRRRYNDRCLELALTRQRRKLTASVASPPWSLQSGKSPKTKVINSGNADNHRTVTSLNGLTRFRKQTRQSAAEPRTCLPFLRRGPAQMMPYVFQMIGLR